MKKLLLIPAIALGMATAQADDFSNYFKVSMDGKEIENGATVYIPGDYLDIDVDHQFGVYYAGHIHVTNTQTEFRPLYTDLAYVTPTGAEMKANPGFYGGMQLCFQGGYDNGGSCLSGNDQFAGFGTFNVPGSDNDTFIWMVDLNAANEEAVVTAKLNMVACEGNATGDFEEIDGADYSITVIFSNKEGNVGGIAADDSEAEYYTLQGVRVANPDKGIYLVKKGSKVSKRVF